MAKLNQILPQSYISIKEDIITLRHVPNVVTFINVHKRSVEDGCFIKAKVSSGIIRTLRTVGNEGAVLQMLENTPRISIRMLTVNQLDQSLRNNWFISFIFKMNVLSRLFTLSII